MTEKRNEKSLGSQESNAITGSRFGVEMTEIWLFEGKLHRGYVVMGLHTGPILFCFFRLIFRATCWAWKLLNYGSYTRASFVKFWIQVLMLSWRQLSLIHNWKVVKNIPWPWDLLWNISFLMHIVILHVKNIASASKVTNFGFSYGK